jgi:hypothetical protein
VAATSSARSSASTASSRASLSLGGMTAKARLKQFNGQHIAVALEEFAAGR